MSEELNARVDQIFDEYTATFPLEATMEAQLMVAQATHDRMCSIEALLERQSVLLERLLLTEGMVSHV